MMEETPSVYIDTLLSRCCDGCWKKHHPFTLVLYYLDVVMEKTPSVYIGTF